MHAIMFQENLRAVDIQMQISLVKDQCLRLLQLYEDQVMMSVKCGFHIVITITKTCVRLCFKRILELLIYKCKFLL